MSGPLAQRVAANIAQLRKQRKMPITELSRRLAEVGHPLSRNRVADIENGRRKVDVDDLAAIAAVLGLASPWDLTAEMACDTCLGAPPAGFRCVTCEREGGGTPRHGV